MTDQSPPRDHHGRFIPVKCPDPNCGAGKLIYEGDGIWECDGLLDPENPNREFDACPYAHRDGDPWPYR